MNHGCGGSRGERDPPWWRRDSAGSRGWRREQIHAARKWGSILDVDKLKQILAALEGTDVTRLTWVEGQETLDLRLGHPPPPTTAVHAVPVATGPVTAIPTPPAVSPVPAATPAVERAAAPGKTAGDKTFTVNSPFVGTFYRARSPDKPALVGVGSVVQK